MFALPPRLRARLFRCYRLLSLILVAVLLGNNLIAAPQSTRAAQSAPAAAATGRSTISQSSTASDTTRSCDLYPIALHSQSLTGVAVGDTIANIANGTQPGAFGWLSWSGSPSEPALVTSLTPPGDSATYTNPDAPDDHAVSIGDWVTSKPGVSDSSQMRQALDHLETLDITVPVWDAAIKNGANSRYRVAAFAQVRLVSYSLPGQNRISARYLGASNCGDVPPPPTRTPTASSVPTLTPTNTALPTATNAPTATSTQTPTNTPTDTATPTQPPTATPTTIPTATATLIATAVPTATPTNTAAPTETPTATETPVSTATATASATPTSPPTATVPPGVPQLVLDVAAPPFVSPGMPIPYAVRVVNQGTATAISSTVHMTFPDGSLGSLLVTDLAPGEVLTGTLTWAVPTLPIRGDDEADSAYRDRLAAGDGKLLTAQLTLDWWDDQGNLYTGQAQQVSTTEQLPILTVTPPSLGTVQPGTILTYDLPIQNQGHASSGLLTLHVTRPDGSTSVVTAAELAPGATTVLHTSWVVPSVAKTTTESDAAYQARLVAPLGAVRLALDWIDQAGNSYGTIDARSGPVDRAALPILALMLDGPDQAAPGQTLTYTLTLTNTGTADAVNRTLTVIMPDGTLQIPALPGALPPGAGAQLTLPFVLPITSTAAVLAVRARINWQDAAQQGYGPLIAQRTTTVLTPPPPAPPHLSPGNQPPLVDAGSPQQTTLPTTTLTLSGTVADDGLPANGTLGSRWSQVSGPGTVTFADPAAAGTTARFSSLGRYVLRLSAFDTELTSTDDLTVTILPANQPPAVDAGRDQTLSLPTTTAILSGTVRDDSLPFSATLQIAWQAVGGPGTVTFSNPHQATTSAQFSAPGRYVLRLSASDTELTSSADVAVTVVSPAATQPGGIFVTGHDADCHAIVGEFNAVGAQHILQRAIAYVTHDAPDPHLLLVSDRRPGTVNCDPLDALQVSGFTHVTLADDGSANSGVLDLHTVDFRAYAAVVVASSPAGWLRQEELDILNARAADLQAYINGGGGLVAQSEELRVSPYVHHGPYGFLPFIVSALPLTQREDGTLLTAAGLAMGLTTADVNGNWSHNVFLTTGDMQVIDTDASGQILSLATRGTNITPGGVNNTPPRVQAGADQQITLPLTSVPLRGQVDDDGVPLTGTLTLEWQLVSGPGTATFAHPEQAQTDVQLSTAGTYVLRLTAGDGALTSRDDVTVTLLPVGGTAAPTPLVSPGWLGSPANGSSVSGLVPITLAAGITLQQGTLDYWPADDSAAVSVPAANVSGSGGAMLATLDTTLLANGSYVIRLSGTSSDGAQLDSGIVVTVAGEYKPGRVRFSVTDLTVPLTGIPIMIGRTYDSLERNRVGDFGYGWTLSLGSPRLAVDPAHNVTLTQPSGKRVTFYFAPESGGGVLGFLRTPAYTPDAGVYGSLTADGCAIVVATGGGYQCFLDANPHYQPTTYTYTDPYGRVYTMGADGSLKAIRDLNGNTLTFSANGIVSSAGDLVVPFVRDGQGQITQITDPAGNVYHYGYDAAGSLVSVTRPGDATPAAYTYDNDPLTAYSGRSARQHCGTRDV